MGESVRTLRKQGAKNKEINESLKDVMKLIEENRKKKLQETQPIQTNKLDIKK